MSEGDWVGIDWFYWDIVNIFPIPDYLLETLCLHKFQIANKWTVDGIQFYYNFSAPFEWRSRVKYY